MKTLVICFLCGNTKDDLMNVSKQTVLVNIDFHCLAKKTLGLNHLWLHRRKSYTGLHSGGKVIEAELSLQAEACHSGHDCLQSGLEMLFIICGDSIRFNLIM